MDKAISSIVVANVVTVNINDRIDTVVDVLDSHKLSCVPVVDSEGKCFGVIS
jgi:CBS domain-containing protein